MRILEIREASVSIASQISNAFIDFSKMTVSVVALVTDVVRDGKPIVGYGFNSNGRYGQSCLLRERFIPRIMSAEPADLITDAGDNLDPERIWRVMMRNEKPGGHGERSVAVGVIDMACWDAVAKIEGIPLHRLIAQRYGRGEPEERLFVYAAGGYYYPGKGLAELQDEMREYLDSGYTVVKMKIGGGSTFGSHGADFRAVLDEDLRRIDAVLELVDSPDRLAVDANGRFDLAQATEYAQALEPLGLRWYEEPGDPLDYELQAELGRRYRGSMATGENLFSHQDARNLLRYGGLRADRDILQFDPALSYGFVEYRKTLSVLAEAGWSPESCIPHGGHQFALCIAAGMGLGGNESYPKVFAPFGGFADGLPVESGTVGLPDAPGVGFETKSALMALFREKLGGFT